MFLICKDNNVLSIYDTKDGSIETVDKSEIDRALTHGLQIENIDGKYNLDSKLATKIVYGATSEGERCASAYLSYECTIVYQKGKAYILVGKYNPIQKGINQFLFRFENGGFVLQSRTKFDQIIVKQNLIPSSEIFEINCRDLLGVPQKLLDKETYLLHFLKSEKAMNKVHALAMNSLMKE